jgi:NAD+ diphosphatase
VRHPRGGPRLGLRHPPLPHPAAARHLRGGAPLEFVLATDIPPAAPEERIWFLFRGDRLLVIEGREGIDALPRLREEEGRALLPLLRLHAIGTLDGVPCLAGEVGADAADPAGTRFTPLRPLLPLFPELLFAAAGRAFQTIDWDRGHAFCGRCGTATTLLQGERGRACPSCGRHFFPPVSPAVIVAVVRDGKLLLARGRRVPPSSFHSVLAGFVEPGETLEQCVRREVTEEAGITLGEVRYFGSQPWPFPHSLMVGFTADWAGGEIVPEEKEIEEAGWYGPEEVRSMPVPPPYSIAGKLVAWFLRGGEGGER